MKGRAWQVPKAQSDGELKAGLKTKTHPAEKKHVCDDLE